MEELRAAVFAALEGHLSEPCSSYATFADIVCDYLVDATSVVPRPYIRAALNRWPTPLADLVDGYACDWLVQILPPLCAPIALAADSDSLTNPFGPPRVRSLPHDCTFATWGTPMLFSHCDRSTRVAYIRLPVRRSEQASLDFSERVSKNLDPSATLPLVLVLKPLCRNPAVERVFFELDVERPVDIPYSGVHLPAGVCVMSSGWHVKGSVYQ